MGASERGQQHAHAHPEETHVWACRYCYLHSHLQPPWYRCVRLRRLQRCSVECSHWAPFVLCLEYPEYNHCLRCRVLNGHALDCGWQKPVHNHHQRASLARHVLQHRDHIDCSRSGTRVARQQLLRYGARRRFLALLEIAARTSVQ